MVRVLPTVQFLESVPPESRDPYDGQACHVSHIRVDGPDDGCVVRRRA